MGSLTAKLTKSFARDRELPATHRLTKGARYLVALARAPWDLRHCQRVGARVLSRGAPIVENLGRIELGADVQLNSTFSPVRLVTGPAGVITLGDEVGVNFGTAILAAERVAIGNRVKLGPYVVLADHEVDGAEPSRPKPIIVEDDVWLAARVRVAKGVRIGRGTAVTAGSVVTADLPPGVVAGGAPARVLRREEPPAAPVARASEVTLEQKEGSRGLIIADFTARELEEMLGVPAAPFAQVIPTLCSIEPTDADFALVWTRPEGVSAAFGKLLEGAETTGEALLADVDAFADAVVRAASALRYVLVASWVVPPFERGLGMRDMGPDGVANALMRMNLRLAERLRAASNVVVLDAQRWITAGGPAAVSPKLWYLGKVGFSRRVFSEAAEDVRAALRGLRGQAKKLCVVDLDGTLWGGVVGDVGWAALRLGGHDGVGEGFKDFQVALRALRRRGVVLAIVSKNEEAVALEAIRSHPEMVLKLDDFSAHRIDWGDKAAHVAELAAELRLGLQSVVFIDDNPVERARVAEALPEVFVPAWPDDPMLYASTLRSLRCFDAPRVTDEDRKRTASYVAEQQRAALRGSTTSLDDWLEGLRTRLQVAPLDARTLPRAAQLLNKTNQMNLRTRRLTERELMAWAAEPTHEVWVVNVSDRFGDSGLTGLLGLDFAGGTTVVVDFVLSCRVMGRKIEEAMVWLAVERARGARTARVLAPFFRTEKNMPCLSFWEGSGFVATDSGFLWEVSTDFRLPAAVTLEGVEGAQVAVA